MAIWYDIEAPYIVRYDTDLAVLQYYYEMSILPIFVLFVLLATLAEVTQGQNYGDEMVEVIKSRSALKHEASKSKMPSSANE